MKNIVIVEDEPLVAEYIREEVSKIFPHSKISVFKSVEEIEKNIASFENVDLALCDVNLGSQRTGIDAAILLRKYQLRKLIFVTANSDDETLSKISSLYPNAYITKPFTQNQLVATVKMVAQMKILTPDLVASSSMGAFEEVFLSLKGCIDTIEAQDKNGEYKSVVATFREGESLFEKFKENRNHGFFGDLLNKVWVAALKLQKIGSAANCECAKKYLDLSSVALAQMRSLGQKLVVE